MKRYESKVIIGLLFLITKILIFRFGSLNMDTAGHMKEIQYLWDMYKREDDNDDDNIRTRTLR